ncbi:MAG TPA: DUF4293 domain-containing protein [Flavisolibacter sp.]|nr:DUF4293 domain-containing protein [Flavisolibacter sp.]
MLQRIQSIWLLLAAVFAAITFRFPFYSGERIIDAASNTSGHVDLNATSTIWLSLLTVITGAIAFVDIFLFDNRKLQLRLCYLGMFFNALLLFVYFMEVGKFMDGKGNFALSCVLHFAIFGFYILAARAIWKDERLIKSMDRLR